MDRNKIWKAKERERGRLGAEKQKRVLKGKANNLLIRDKDIELNDRAKEKQTGRWTQSPMVMD